MNVLIIEDDVFKAKRVSNFVAKLGASSIDRRSSYNSGLDAIRNGEYDLCILDMSLPTYDVSPADEGYETLSYGGELLLREMQRRRIVLPTVVLTQFTTFPEKLEEKPLEELVVELKTKYQDNYIGCIFYADEETSWQSGIEDIFNELSQ